MTALAPHQSTFLREKNVRGPIPMKGSNSTERCVKGSPPTERSPTACGSLLPQFLDERRHIGFEQREVAKVAFGGQKQVAAILDELHRCAAARE